MGSGQGETGEAYAWQRPPPALSLPLVLDSPHSARPDDRDPACLARPDALATSWDAFVDTLWSGAVGVGASLLAAQFPRAFIDANRAESDLDPALIGPGWPEDRPLAPQAYSARGMGLIRRDILPGQPMYAAPLPASEVIRRIDRFHRPYRDTLVAEIAAQKARFGAVWHVDCHSMKSRGNAMNIDAGARRPDVVLGDLDGRACAPDFTDLVASGLRRQGLSVALNTPYKGGDIVQAIGRPAEGVHSLQIELNRALYMDETRFEPHEGFAQLAGALTTLAHEMAAYVKAQIQAGGPG